MSQLTQLLLCEAGLMAFMATVTAVAVYEKRRVMGTILVASSAFILAIITGVL